MRHEVVAEVGVGRDPAEHADAALERGGIVAGVLDGGPGRLEEDAMLRIGELGFTPAHPEEGCIEGVVAIHDGPRVDEVRVGRVGPGGTQLGLAEWPDRFDAPAQVVPEALDVGRARESSRHADDGNLLQGLVIRHARVLVRGGVDHAAGQTSRGAHVDRPRRCPIVRSPVELRAPPLGPPAVGWHRMWT